MVFLGDKAQMEARFGPFGDSANLDARWVHGLHRMYHRLEHCVGRTRWNSQVTWVRLKIVLNFTQNRCMIYAEHNIGLEIIWDQADGTPR
jgi:hypothetical protein